MEEKVTTCPECGRKYENTIRECSNCGYPFDNNYVEMKKAERKALAYIKYVTLFGLLFFLIIIVILCIYGNFNRKARSEKILTFLKNDLKFGQDNINYNGDIKQIQFNSNGKCNVYTWNSEDEINGAEDSSENGNASYSVVFDCFGKEYLKLKINNDYIDIHTLKLLIGKDEKGSVIALGKEPTSSLFAYRSAYYKIYDKTLHEKIIYTNANNIQILKLFILIIVIICISLWLCIKIKQNQYKSIQKQNELKIRRQEEKERLEKISREKEKLALEWNEHMNELGYKPKSGVKISSLHVWIDNKVIYEAEIQESYVKRYMEKNFEERKLKYITIPVADIQCYLKEGKEYNDRKTIIRYYKNQEMELKQYNGFDVYNYLLKMIPEKDIISIHINEQSDENKKNSLEMLKDEFESIKNIHI